jgi:hypothetical protein
LEKAGVASVDKGSQYWIQFCRRKLKFVVVALRRLIRMNADTQAPAAPLSRHHARPARSLIGWLPTEMAQATLAGPGVQPPYGPDIVNRAAAAHAAVAARQPHAADTGVVTDLPNDLVAYVDELRSQPFYQLFAAEGWQVRMAELHRVRALQPTVHTDHAIERTQGVRSDDLLSLARVTLPHSRAKELLATAPTADGRGWILTCRNPQLRVRGPYSGDRDENGYKTKVFGIETEVANSLMQVVRWRGAYILRDGYHRAYGLLSQGIASVPVLYHEFPDHQPPLVAAGLFDPNVYISERAPLLRDYLDDAVSANIEVRRTQKTLVIQVQVMELDTPIL